MRRFLGVLQFQPVPIMVNLTERVSISSKETTFTLSDRQEKAFVLQVENSTHPIIYVESNISSGNVVKIATRNFLVDSSDENIMQYRNMHLNGDNLNISSTTIFQPSVITMAPNADHHAVHIKQGEIFTSDEKFIISTCNVSCITDTNSISTTTSASASTTTQAVSTTMPSANSTSTTTVFASTLASNTTTTAPTTIVPTTTIAPTTLITTTASQITENCKNRTQCESAGGRIQISYGEVCIPSEKKFCTNNTNSHGIVSSLYVQHPLVNEEKNREQ